MNANEIGVKLQELPDHLVPEVFNYIELLLSQYGKKDVELSGEENSFRFDWEGGLSSIRDQYTSVELQHRSLEWR